MILTDGSAESSAAAFFSCMQERVERLCNLSTRLNREQRATTKAREEPKPKREPSRKRPYSVRNRTWTDTERRKLIELRESGMWLRRIARSLSRSEWSVKMELNQLVRKARASR